MKCSIQFRVTPIAPRASRPDELGEAPSAEGQQPRRLLDTPRRAVPDSCGGPPAMTGRFLEFAKATRVAEHIRIVGSATMRDCPSGTRAVWFSSQAA